MVISHSYVSLPEGSAAGALATIMGMFHDVPRNIAWLKSAPHIYRSPSYIIQHIHTYPKLHRMTMYDYRCHFLDTHRYIYICIYKSYLVYLYIACRVMAEPRKNRILPRGKQEEATEVLRKAVQRFLPKDVSGVNKSVADQMMVNVPMKSH